MAYGANLVLEEIAEWLDEFEVHIRGQAADVVMAFDRGCMSASGLDHIGVQGALHEKLTAVTTEFSGLRFEHPDEALADDLAFALRIGDVIERGKETITSLDVDEFHSEMGPESGIDLVALTGAHQTGVDVDADQLITDRSMYERGGHRGIDATREATEHLALTHLGADSADGAIDDRLVGPVRRCFGDVEQKPFQHRLSIGRMPDLRMELHGVDTARRTGQRRDGDLVRAGRGHETGRHLLDGIEVAHPHVLFGREVA